MIRATIVEKEVGQAGNVEDRGWFIDYFQAKRRLVGIGFRNAKK